MKTSIGLSLLSAVLATSLYSASLLANDDTQASATAKTQAADVITFGKNDLAGVDLPQVAPLSKDIVISGSNQNWQKLLYVDQVGVAIWQSEAATLSLNPQGIDEYIFVLEGELTLTSAAGKVSNFTVGDSFVLPKEFIGTWQTHGKYRQLMVLNPSFLGEEH